MLCSVYAIRATVVYTTQKRLRICNILNFLVLRVYHIKSSGYLISLTFFVQCILAVFSGTYNFPVLIVVYKHVSVSVSDLARSYVTPWGYHSGKPYTIFLYRVTIRPSVFFFVLKVIISLSLINIRWQKHASLLATLLLQRIYYPDSLLQAMC